MGTQIGSRCMRLAVLALLGVTVGCASLGGSEPTADEVLEQAGEAADASRGEVAKATEELRDKSQAVARAGADLARARAEREEAARKLREAQARLRQDERAVSENATDLALFRLVQRRLLEDDRLKDAAISVYVVEGVVTLQGDIPDEETRYHALELVRKVPGVTHVDSRMEGAGLRFD